MAFLSLHPLSCLQEENRGAFRERVLTWVIYKWDLTVTSSIDCLEILRDCSIRESSSAWLANLLITFSPPIYLSIYLFLCMCNCWLIKLSFKGTTTTSATATITASITHNLHFLITFLRTVFFVIRIIIVLGNSTLPQNNDFLKIWLMRVSLCLKTVQTMSYNIIKILFSGDAYCLSCVTFWYVIRIQRKWRKYDEKNILGNTYASVCEFGFLSTSESSYSS